MCYTIEDRARRAGEPKIPGRTAIPCGRYLLAWTPSVRFKRHTLQFLDVPEFSGIRVHIGNRSADTEGCLIPGLQRTAPIDDWVGQSGAAVAALEALIVPQFRTGEAVWINVIEEPEIDLRQARQADNEHTA